MIKGLIVVIILIVLLDYALMVASSQTGRREEHEAYERWKNGHDKQK